MIKNVTVGFMIAGIAVLGLASEPALARKSDKTAKQDKKEKKEKKEDKAGGKLIETYGDWTASLAQGKVKTCYALARPKSRSPDGKHDQAYVFIADRPAEKVRNEVSIVMGFPIKEGSAAKAKAGRSSFDLVAVSNAFFTKDPGDDQHFVDAMKHGGTLTVKASPLKGPAVTDSYALDGFKQALERVQKECK